MKMSNNHDLNWSDIAFGSKKILRELNAIFIPIPREMSGKRLAQIIKTYLPIGNIVFGCTDELYIEGFEGQAQFKTLRPESVAGLVEKVNNSAIPNKIMILHCQQSDILSIYKKVKFRLVLLVNGSWKYSFHCRPEYYTLVSQNIPFEFISPFTSEDEAKQYADNFIIQKFDSNDRSYSDIEMLRIANQSATSSFDNAFQVGAALAQKTGEKYKLIATSFNKTVPYQTFAWHHGALRERHLSPSGDLNYYDTVHAEVMLLLHARKDELALKNKSIFINLLPCPSCARMLCETDIEEIVYSLDHSDGYAVALLEKAGKSVRRIVDPNDLKKVEE